MKRVTKLVPEQRFKVLTESGFENHRIDQGGNHFIDGKCVNPSGQEYILHSDGIHRDAEVGDTYPGKNVKRYPSVIKTN